MWDKWIVIAIGTLIGLIGFALISRSERRQQHRFDRRRAERTDQTPDEFATDCGNDVPSDVAVRVRGISAKVSDLAYSLPERTIEAARLRASDDVNADLGYDLDSLSTAHVYTELEREFGIRISLDAESLGIKVGAPVTVAHLTRAVVAQLKNPQPIPNDSFQPGFRFSTSDGLILFGGAVWTFVAGQLYPWLGYAIGCVVGHFFLFCNIVRMSRGLELAWSGVILALTGGATLVKWPDWPVAIVGTFAATAVCVALEMRKPSYHGVLWQRINPTLPEWWAEHGGVR